ncbi:MAG: sulfatase-like hydrolase/transferase, partial [Gaiellaceae bacterium]
TLLCVLSAAPLAFLVYFLLVSPVADLTLADDPDVALASVDARAPVVLVVFDEFPVSSLLDGNGEIDAVRYPNIAELAEGSTWFRNASTVSYSTTQAVPAILTGSNPEGAGPPVFSSHPRNIFTLLGADYEMNVLETYTRLCPDAVCEGRDRLESSGPDESSLYEDAGVVYLHLLAPPRLEDALPPITQQWMDFGRQEDEVSGLLDQALAESPEQRPQAKGGYHDAQTRAFTRFLTRIEGARTPSLNFAHVWLPHAPWWYLPSGRQASVGAAPAPGRDAPTDTWRAESLTLQAYQRHLLQVGFVDRLAGELLDRLRRTGTYERSLVVLTADHGVSFRPGESQRGASQETLQDIAFVPLFVKEPGQTRGAVVDYHVQTTDVLPTIADVLGIRIPWRVDGRTALRDPRWDTVRVRTNPREDPDREATAPFAALLEQQERSVERKVALFGAGSWEHLYAQGPHRELLGRPVTALPVSGQSADRAAIDHEGTRRLLAAMEPDLPFVPSLLQGHVEGDGVRAGRTLAVAVNGTVAALATVYSDERFSALAPESAFRTGANTVEFFWVDGEAGAERLTRLRSS